MIVGNGLMHAPKWYIAGSQIEMVSNLKIVGTILNNILKHTEHIAKRDGACRRIFHSL